MLRRFTILLVIGVVIAGVLCPVLATNSQNLTWSIAEGDKFDYDLRYRMDDGSGNVVEIVERVYFIVTNLPTIPETVTILSEIGFVRVDTYWANGSVAIFNFYMVLFYAFPTGNWSAIQSLFDDIDAYQNRVVDFFETTDVWGFAENPADTSQQYRTYGKMELLKENGVAGYFYYEMVNEQVELFEQLYIELILLGYTPLSTSTLYLLVIYSAIGVAVIVIIIAYRKRS